MPYLILITFILAPAYVIKFKFLGLPSDLLMLWVILVWIIFLAWLTIKKQFTNYLNWRRSLDKKLLIFISLFLISGILSLFVKGVDRAKLGEFIVLFLEPISLFFISGYIFKQYPQTKRYLLLTTYYLLTLAGIYAIIQYLTLLGLPSAWWGNSDEPKRAISFFIHPNFYALWAAPLLAFLIADLRFKIEDLKNNWHFVLAWILGAAGLFLSLSRAGWIGLGAAVIVYLTVAANCKIRKIALGIFIALIIIVFSVPNFRYRVTLPFYGEKSTVSRFSLWHTGIKGIEESPVFGLGLGGFSKNWLTLNTDAGLTDTHNFPHNIFLDFWVETGLLGLISFIGIASIYIYRGLRAVSPPYQGGVPATGGGGGWSDDRNLKLATALFLIAIIFQGLSDNPYFKNDLAMVFWIILSLCI